MSTLANLVSFKALLTLADIREDEVAGRTETGERYSHDKRFTRTLLRRGFVHVFAGDRDGDCLATTPEGVKFLVDNIDLVCSGLSASESVKRRKALGIRHPIKEEKTSAKKPDPKKKLVSNPVFEGLQQAVTTLTAERDALTAERDKLKATLAEIEKDCKETDTRQVREMSTANAERDYCHSQLLYAHRLAATGTKLDDIEKMRVVFGLITSETKPHDPNPWWSVAALGTLGMMGVVGALGYAAYAKKGGAK